jgi:hypothetical protein
MSSAESRQAAHQLLLKAKENLLWKRRVEERLAHADRSLEEQNARLQIFQKRLDEETVDVKTLTGLTVTSVIASVFGSKERRLQKERQEAAAAALKLEAARQVADALQLDRDLIADQLAGMEGAEVRYEAALIDKGALLREDGDAGLRLADLAEQEAANAGRKRETQEALVAGQAAQRQLEQVVQELRGAQDWGTWDLWGGGMVATHLKHNRIDQARLFAVQAQATLNRFKRELGDLGKNLVADIEIGSFSLFADYFFDGLIMDLAVQSKISSALGSAQLAECRVDTVVSMLLRDLDECTRMETDLGRRRIELIEGA